MVETVVRLAIQDAWTPVSGAALFQGPTSVSHPIRPVGVNISANLHGPMAEKQPQRPFWKPCLAMDASILLYSNRRSNSPKENKTKAFEDVLSCPTLFFKGLVLEFDNTILNTRLSCLKKFSPTRTTKRKPKRVEGEERGRKLERVNDSRCGEGRIETG